VLQLAVVFLSNEATQSATTGHGQLHFLDVDLKPLLLDEDLTH
jgi:hypothetical protein